MVWENIPAVLFLSKAKLMPPYMACKWDVHGGDSCVLLQIVGSLEISKPRRFTLFQHIVLRCPRKISTTVSRNMPQHFDTFCCFKSSQRISWNPLVLGNTTKCSKSPSSRSCSRMFSIYESSWVPTPGTGLNASCDPRIMLHLAGQIPRRAGAM